MGNKNLKVVIAEAAREFALKIIKAVRSSTLQELTALQGSMASVPARRRVGRPSAPMVLGKRGPGRPPGSGNKKKTYITVAAPRKKRTSFPKCAYPGCEKNRFPMGEGYCGEHYRARKAGKIR